MCNFLIYYRFLYIHVYPVNRLFPYPGLWFLCRVLQLSAFKSRKGLLRDVDIISLVQYILLGFNSLT